MSDIWVICKKDFRRFWLLILAWLTVLAIGMLSLLGEGATAERIASYWEIGKWAVIAIVVFAFIHEDGLSGNREYWMTRPIRHWRLLVAKLISLAVILVFPTGIAWALGARQFGVDALFAWNVGVNHMVIATAFILLMGVVSAIADNIVYYALGLIVVGILGHAMEFSYMILGRPWIYSPMAWHNWAADQYATILGVSLISLGLLFYQALYRNRKVTIFLGLTGGILVWDTVLVFPHLDRGGGDNAKVVAAEKIEVSDARIERDFRLKGAKGTKMWLLYSWANEPADRLFEISETCSTFADQNQSYRWRLGREGYSHLEGSAPNFFTRVNEIPLADDSVNKSLPPTGAVGQLMTRVVIEEFELRTYIQPWQDETAFEVPGIKVKLSTHRNSSNVNLLPRFSTIAKGVISSSHNYEIYLRNRITGERTTSAVIKPHRRISIGIESVDTSNALAKIPTASAPLAIQRDFLDRSWLANADIVVLEKRWVGSVEKTLTLNNVTIPSDRPRAQTARR